MGFYFLFFFVFFYFFLVSKIFFFRNFFFLKITFIPQLVFNSIGYNNSYETISHEVPVC